HDESQRHGAGALDLSLDRRGSWWASVGDARKSARKCLPVLATLQRRSVLMAKESEMPPVVFVVDDDPSVRESLTELFTSVGLEVAAFGSPAQFLRDWTGESRGCLVLDVRLPGASGLDFQADLVRADIQLPVIFITGHGDIPMTVRAMKAGAVEFLTKPFRDQDLLDAVQRGLDLDRTRREQQKPLAELRARFKTLTAREQEVIGFVSTGL